MPRTSATVCRSDLAASFVLFGSYFPAWIACLLIGVAFSVAGHWALRATGMVAAVPFVTLFYLLLALLGATGSWLVLFAGG